MKQHISIVVTVRAKNKRSAKAKLIALMNHATSSQECHKHFPEWGFHSEYKMAGEKVKK